MTSEIQQLEHEIQQSKKTLELGNALERLFNNRDFKNIILKGYLEQEAVRLVHLKADPSMAHPDKQASVIRDIDAIGSFDGFLREIKRQADLARKSVASAEDALDAIRAEGLSDE